MPEKCTLEGAESEDSEKDFIYDADLNRMKSVIRIGSKVYGLDATRK